MIAKCFLCCSHIVSMTQKACPKMALSRNYSAALRSNRLKKALLHFKAIRCLHWKLVVG